MNWRRSLTLRSALLGAVVSLRATAFLCLCVRSIQEQSGNAALIVAVLNNLLLFFMLGVFLREWMHSWPTAVGGPRPMTKLGKGIYLAHMISAAQTAALVAMTATSVPELNSSLIGVYMTLEFLSNSLAQFIAIDVFADRRTNEFVFGTPLTEKHAEKNSDEEFEANAARLVMSQLGK
jgi:hypothetical protein